MRDWSTCIRGSPMKYRCISSYLCCPNVECLIQCENRLKVNEHAYLMFCITSNEKKYPWIIWSMEHRNFLDSKQLSINEPSLTHGRVMTWAWMWWHCCLCTIGETICTPWESRWASCWVQICSYKHIHFWSYFFHFYSSYCLEP